MGNGKKNAGSSKNSSNKGKNSTPAPQGSQPLVRKMSTAKKIGVTVVCVLMALMMMVPSLIMLFGNGTVSQAQTSQTSSSTATASTTATSSTTDASSTTSSTTDSTTSAESAAYVNTEYEAKVDSIKKELEASPSDNTLNKSLAYTYFQWGSALVDAGENENDNSDLVDIWKQAATYYSTYLQTDESGEAEVNRALATYYGGDLSKAIRELEAYSKTDDGAQSASVWANLGLLYEAASKTSDARDAYNKALEVDPDDAAGVQSFVNTRLKTLVQ